MDPMKGFVRLAPVVLVLATMSAACTSQQALPTTPTTVAPPTVVETFTGSLIAFGSNLHQFTVSQLGEVDITLKATNLQPTVDPETGDLIPPEDPTAVPALALAIGTPTTTIFGPVCAAIKSIAAKADPSPQIVGSALAGNFCVSYSDNLGILTNVVDYTIVVAHP